MAPGSRAGNLIEADTGSGALQYTLGAGNSHCSHPELISGVSDPVPQGPGSGRVFYPTQSVQRETGSQVRAGGIERAFWEWDEDHWSTSKVKRSDSPLLLRVSQRPQTSRDRANSANRANRDGQ